jgi:LmbE family N-acetylglucosaminyl deacetylase
VLTLDLAGGGQGEIHVLCVGAHSDDIEIGCGGTIVKLLEQGVAARVTWVVLAASGDRVAEARASAERLLCRAKQKDIVIKDFRDGFFPYIGAEVKGFFEELKRTVSPDVIFTHCRHDLHQDHRVTAELTWNTFRNHLVLEYEIMKYDGDLGTPNLYSHLSDAHARTKVRHLLEVFRTQRSRAWFTENAFLSLMRIRGVECNAPQEFAEGFYCRKMVLR